MPTEITMPKLSDTMTEGTLLAWNKVVGERVERGDILAEVETDKANMELETFVSGVLLETRAQPGDLVPVGEVIAVIGESGEPVQAGVQVQAPTALQEAAKEIVRESSCEETQPPAQSAAVLEKASPMVRRLAREMGIDLTMVSGTGPEGRILKEDLERFPSRKATHTFHISPSPGKGMSGKEEAPAAGEVASSHAPEIEPLSRMRAAIARTVTESWQTIPQFTATVHVDMGAAEGMHHGFKESNVPISLTDIVIKAAALALASFPRLNATWASDHIILHPGVHMGIAVDMPNGLLVPVVQNCEVLSLREIGLRSREIIAAARSGGISPGELSGGTFTISNLGMFGVDNFTALILPSQAAILAIGAITDRAIVRNGTVTSARIMSATISADHRVADGAYTAGFLGEVKKLLENPVRLLL
jgi:pyruvate dehydrogenase E2 component (dihydrolipoamide acetyltransferase)